MSPTQEFESLKGSTVYLTGKTYLILNFVGVFRIKVGTNSKISELKRLARVCTFIFFCRFRTGNDGIDII